MSKNTITRRTRSFGWNFSTTPTGEDAYSIEPPSVPYYIGTVKQVMDARRNDAVFNSLGGAFYSERYFLNNKPIIFVDGVGPSALLDGDVNKIEVVFI